VPGVTWYAKTIESNGLGIVVRRLPRTGTADDRGRNYLLVHGLGVSARYFELLAAKLATVGNVWLVDLPGHGDAPKPHRAVTIADHASILALAIERSAIANPVLVGHSMGCQVVTELCILRPEITGSLVLLSPTINPRRHTFRQQSLDLIHDFFRETAKANRVGLFDYFFRCGLIYYLQQARAMLVDRIESRLPLISIKTLVIDGSRDPVVPLDWARSISSTLPNARLEVVPGAHVIMYTAPDQIATLIAEELA
jgi:pimeloyl-ACP methyl ester carboxylesterase